MSFCSDDHVIWTNNHMHFFRGSLDSHISDGNEPSSSAARAWEGRLRALHLGASSEGWLRRLFLVPCTPSASCSNHV